MKVDRISLFAGALGSLAAGTFLAVWGLRADLYAAFGPIDDNEFISWLHPNGRLPLSDAYSTLMNQTEVGRFGEYERYRPAIYVSKVLETVAFGDNVRGHYVVVIAMFVLACSLMGLAVTWWILAAARIRRSGVAACVAVVLGVLATSLISSLAPWADIATRLGPSERLAAVGFGLALLGLTALGFNSHWSWWFAVVIGVVLAVLSKENFLLVALAPLAVATYRTQSLKRSKLEFLGGVAALIPAVLLMVALAHTMFGGVDVYGASTGTSRLTSTITALVVTYKWYWLPALVSLLLAYGAWVMVIWKSARGAAIIVGVLVVLSVAWRMHDSWIYAVHGYAYPRYELVPQLFKALALSAALALSIAALRRATTEAARIVSCLALIVAGIVTLALFKALPHGLTEMKRIAELNRDATTAYSAALESAIAASKQAGNPTIGIVSQQPMDAVEIIRAMALDLQRRDREVKVVVIPDLSGEQQTSGLAPLLTQLSTTGNPLASIEPLESVTGDKLACLIINGSTTRSEYCDPERTAEVPARYM